MMLECNNTKDYRLKLLRCKICLSFFNLHVFFWNCATDVATSFLCNILLEQTRRRKMWRPSRGLRIEVAVPLVKGLGVGSLTPFSGCRFFSYISSVERMHVGTCHWFAFGCFVQTRASSSTMLWVYEHSCLAASRTAAFTPTFPAYLIFVTGATDGACVNCFPDILTMIMVKHCS